MDAIDYGQTILLIKFHSSRFEPRTHQLLVMHK